MERMNKIKAKELRQDIKDNFIKAKVIIYQKKKKLSKKGLIFIPESLLVSNNILSGGYR